MGRLDGLDWSREGIGNGLSYVHCIVWCLWV